MSKIFKAFLVLLAIFVAVLGILGGYQTSQKFKYPVAYADYIVKYSKANDLDPFLVMAVIKVESILCLRHIRVLPADLCSLLRKLLNGTLKN